MTTRALGARVVMVKKCFGGMTPFRLLLVVFYFLKLGVHNILSRRLCLLC